jgi:hypothetical protein
LVSEQLYFIIGEKINFTPREALIRANLISGSLGILMSGRSSGHLILRALGLINSLMFAITGGTPMGLGLFPGIYGHKEKTWEVDMEVALYDKSGAKENPGKNF